MINNKNYIEAFTKMVVVLVLSYHVKSHSKCTKYIGSKSTGVDGSFQENKSQV